ncbi:MAG: FKBP-type peptidyl-prolyl cis-trans isomerase [Bacteroidota bacterium]
MIILNEKVAKFTYTLFENTTEGRVIEDVPVDNPMEIVFGQGKLIPFFEERLIGLRAGDDFEIKVPSGDAFGESNPKAIYELSKETFRVNGAVDQSLFAIGKKLPMRDRNGNVLDGYVKSSTDETVTIDFNHPLAGIDIVFKGNVIEVREATEEELNPPSHGCGCGSGGGHGHGGGSCSSDGHGEGDSCGCENKGEGGGSCNTDGQGHHHEEGHSCGCGH